MPVAKFTTTLQADEPGRLAFLFFDWELLGEHHPKGIKSVRVKGTTNEKPFEGNAQPWRDGQCCVMVNAQMRKAVGVQGDDKVKVVMEPDLKPVA
ncbi:MAG: DUF1905 domain-containing protein [Dehalococcoidia bacterium]|nr:DUF1905 domain-containing protein [Dehalococcoidia bacterium]